MTKTPWNWIITAFILAALFLVSFGYYRNEAKSNNSFELLELKRSIQDKDNMIADRDRQIESKDDTIAILSEKLASERRRKEPAISASTSDSDDIKKLKRIIESKQSTIAQREDSIRTLNASIKKLQEKIEYFKNAPK